MAIVAAAAIPPSASAATTLGANPSGLCGSGTDTFVQRGAPPSVPYAAATSGVITSWSFATTAAAPTLVKLRLLRPTNTLATYTTVGLSRPESPPLNQVSTYPARLPIQAGDVLGFTAIAPTTYPCGTAVAGYTADYVNSDPADGSTQAYGTIGIDFQINISAQLEPDADGDGFGDETQDLCPTDASTQGPCPDRTPPDTTITKGPKAKSKQRRVTFEFSSSEPGSSFECSVDGSGFASCASPLIKSFGRGKHVFQVRARDAAGNVDATPAIESWNVVKKKGKKGKKGGEHHGGR